MEDFNQELYEKCITSSELLFSDMLTDVIAKEQLSSETVEIIKEDNAKWLYNLALESFWIVDTDIDERIHNHFNPDPDFMVEELQDNEFDVISWLLFLS